MIEIDLGRAVELVLAEIAQKPEGYKYRDNPLTESISCRNILVGEDGNIVPGCLVGSIVISAGIPAIDIDERRLSRSISYDLFTSFEDRMNVTVAAQAYLRRVQAEQDSDQTWAFAHMSGLQYVLSIDGPNYFTQSESEWLDVRN